MTKFLIILSIFLISFNSYSKNAQEILEKLDQNTRFNSSYSKSQMTILNNGEPSSTMEFEAYTKKVDQHTYQLSRYLSPARLKGTSILSKEGNIWYYNKRSNRVRLLSKSAKKGSMMGSSFSYDDLDMDYLVDFYSQIIEETSKYYLLKLTPKNSEKSYRYLNTYIDKTHFLIEKIEYFDENEINYKTMNILKYKQLRDKWYESSIEMKDNISNKTTLIETFEDSLKINIDITDSEFSERKLKQ